MVRVLFVCSGNTCRSPMAAGLLNAKAQMRQLPVTANSAGLAAFPGDPASENAVAAMAECGVDLSAHHARAVTAYLLAESDLVVCMSDAHRRTLLPYVPEERLLVPPGGVPDPFGGDLSVYRRCRDVLADFAEALLNQLSEVKIRPMAERDLSAAAALETECFSTPWSETALREAFVSAGNAFFVAERCGEVCGYLGLQTVLDEAYLFNIAVTASARRQGIGKALLKTAIATCKNKGCTFLSLEVRESNGAAIALYQTLGFAERGRRKRFYAAPPEDGLILTMDL